MFNERLTITLGVQFSGKSSILYETHSFTKLLCTFKKFQKISFLHTVSMEGASRSTMIFPCGEATGVACSTGGVSKGGGGIVNIGRGAMFSFLSSLGSFEDVKLKSEVFSNFKSKEDRLIANCSGVGVSGVTGVLTTSFSGTKWPRGGLGTGFGESVRLRSNNGISSLFVLKSPTATLLFIVNSSSSTSS